MGRIRVLTPSQRYQDLAVGPGQVVIDYKVPFPAPSLRCRSAAHFTLWPSQVAENRVAQHKKVAPVGSFLPLGVRQEQWMKNR